MAKTKYIMHDCAYCHKPTKMELVGQMQTEDSEKPAQKVWYRCTRCKHSALLDRQTLAQPKNGTGAKLDKGVCTHYSKDQVFTVGQAIYHEEWDDVGKVIAKQKTSDGTHAITVAFEKLGERKLIEHVTASVETEIVQVVPA
ncbi:MAG: hypothetical protein HY088_03540 [Ignavibacteriales bacterium]|nr:hypothetical protein [Ignavibacteriales bacterium]